MRLFRYSVLALTSLIVFGVGKAYSQTPVTYGGALLDIPTLSHFDLLQLSQSNYGFSTARSAAMGGAMTSLGGDMSSININPAGLGMYRSTNFSITTGLNIATTKSDFNAFDRTTTRFSVNNIGLAVPVYYGTGGLTGVTFAFSYNRVADFNYRGGMTLPAGKSSLADVFNVQLNGLYPYLNGDGWDGISADRLENYPFENRDIFVNEWGGVLGYLGFINEPASPTSNEFFVNGLGSDIDIIPSMWYTTKGYVNEYSAAFGFNVQNKLYLGVTFAAQDILLTKRIFFGEQYLDNTSGEPDVMFSSMTYGQYSRYSGWGSNIKLGAIIRPTDGLRIGLAYHTPTWVRDFNHDYMAQIETVRINGTRHSANSALAWTSYKFNTPSKLLTGISYTFGSKGLITADYEAVWYDSIKKRVSALSNDPFNDNVKNDFNTVSNFRVGAEYRVTPELALRAGYANYGKVISNEYTTLFYMATNRYENYSAGIGYRISPYVTMDLTYIYMTQHLKDYDLYYLSGNELKTAPGNIQSAEFTPSTSVTNPKYNNHLISLSFNFVF